MRMITGVVFVIGMLLPTSARALTITQGYVALERVHDHCAVFSGDGFFLSACTTDGVNTHEAFGVDYYEYTMKFHSEVNAIVSAEVGDESCLLPAGRRNVDCGEITVRSVGLPACRLTRRF